MIFNMACGKTPMTYRGTKTIALFHFDSVPITPTVGRGTVLNSSGAVNDGKFLKCLFVGSQSQYNKHFLYEDNRLNIQQGPFTYEFFCKSNTGISLNTFSGNHFSISIGSTSFDVRYRNSSSYSVSGSKTSSPDFIHFAVVGDGGPNGNRKFSVFLDGVKKGEMLCDYLIDYNKLFFSCGTSGALDELRVSNVARYATNFTPPSAPFAPD